VLRFAPDLSKQIDINSLRIAIFNYILSKQLDEQLLIRIDDQTKDDEIEKKQKNLLEILNLFSIEYIQIVNQSGNLKYHQKLAMQLMGQKKAFACFCSDEKLEEIKQSLEKENKPFRYDGFCENLSDETVLNCNAPFRVRIKKPKESISLLDDKGSTSFKPYDIDSFVILNHDKTPTYNYASAIDDMLYDISLVISDEDDSLENAREVFIRNSLNYDKQIKYIHIPKINTQGKDQISINRLIEEGFLPSAIANYLVLLGNETKDEIFSLEDAIKWFDIEKLSKNSPTFDMDKLKYINKIHLENMDNMRLSKILGFADEDIGKLSKLFLDEISTIKGLKSKIGSIFSTKTHYKNLEKEFEIVKNCIKNGPFFENYNDFENYLIKKTDLKGEKLLKPLIYILTGEKENSKIEKIYPLIKNYLGEITK